MMLVGQATGPDVYVPYLDMMLPTFINKVDNHLGYHVPWQYRGKWRVEEWMDLPETSEGFARCHGTTKNDKTCKVAAVNFSLFCSNHGGALHPLDRYERDPRGMSRREKFLEGYITVDDLDEEELARGEVRGADGRFPATPSKVVPRSMHDEMIKELFARADEKLRTSLVDSVGVMQEIAMGSAYEPADRIKAAQWIYERMRGKVPTEIKVSQDEPWEMVVQEVAGGSRAASRAERGTATSEDLETLEAEVVQEAVVVDEEPGQEQEDDIGVAAVHDVGHDKPADPHRGTGYRWTPQDPDDRQSYERIKAEREELKRARSKRYAARSRGFTTIDQAPFSVSLTKTNERPANDMNNTVFAVKFTPPEETKVPQSELNRQKRNRSDW